MQAIIEQIRLDAKACDQRKIQQAERMSPAQRFFAGAELFDDACEVTLHGIQNDHPTWSRSECLAELRQLFKPAAR